MRKEDLDRLAVKYPTPGMSPARLTPALGVSTPHWDSLIDAVVADLSEREPFGIGWWAPHPGVARRILISDQLCTCLQSAGDNLVEAGIHWLEYLGAIERANDRISETFSVRGNSLLESPPSCVLDEITVSLPQLHVVGVARALSGSIDCLASVVIGVLAFETPILQARLTSLKTELESAKRNASATSGAALQRAFAVRFDEILAAAGEPGWLDWVIDFRNMLVHRGRRIYVQEVRPRSPRLYRADGNVRLELVSHLPKDPSRSDVEAGRHGGLRAVLTEDAGTTLRGLIESTRKLVDDVGNELRGIWQQRRSNPPLLQQPRKQWPKVDFSQRSRFVGYKPGSVPLTAPALAGGSLLWRRMRAAALDDATRQRWITFEADAQDGGAGTP
jgi:hypothetical protein